MNIVGELVINKTTIAQISRDRLPRGSRRRGPAEGGGNRAT
jgi:hypothetical protein